MKKNGILSSKNQVIIASLWIIILFLVELDVFYKNTAVSNLLAVIDILLFSVLIYHAVAGIKNK